MTVVSSNSESDSSESESNSESESSDDLENWMILGPGNQDGDQSISLNLEGGSDSSAGMSFVYRLPPLCVCSVCTGCFVHCSDFIDMIFVRLNM